MTALTEIQLSSPVEQGASGMALRPAWVVAVMAAVLLGLVAAAYLARPAQAQVAVRNQGYIPFSDAPIFYRTRELTDPIALLQRQLDEGKARLEYEPGHGYLKSALKLLGIPTESQTLVFSKTSFKHTHISPEHPRALYYNDDVYIGAVHQGDALEIVSFDPVQGAIFYLLDERQTDKPVFQRAELDCTQCHIAPGTRGVPGVLLRSVYPSRSGAMSPRAPIFITDQKSPLKDRWGGWYVTGPLAAGSLGNAVVVEAPGAEDFTSTAAPQLGPIAQPFDPSAFLAPTSDGVAHLVLAHQTQMHNLITLTNYQTRIALHAAGLGEGQTVALDALPEKQRQQIVAPAEQLLRHLLFVNEAPLGGLDARQLVQSSAFARQFAAQGVRDSRQRSLRDFDLHDRMFRFPCSYLIYSAHFDALPEPAKGYVYQRLLDVLSGKDQGPDFAGLSADDRKAILSILLETKPNLPAEWRDYARANRLRIAATAGRANRNN